MGQAPYKKNRIAARARNINLIILALIFTIVTVIAALIINKISNKASMNYIRSHALETSDKFFAYISQDLPLVMKASLSKTIADWFSDETNEEKRSLAYDDMLGYNNLLQGTHLYFTIQESLNEYIIRGENPRKDFILLDKLSPQRTDDLWYFECLDSRNDYTLKISIEKSSSIRRLWINHKVMMNGEIIGVLSSALKIPDVHNKIFNNFNADTIKGYVIDRKGVIQLDSSAYGIYNEEKGKSILDENSDPQFSSTINAYLGRINEFFNDQSAPEIIKLTKGHYKYATIKPIGGTDWSVVVFHNSMSNTEYLLPLFFIMLSAMYLCMVGSNALMDRLLYTPIYHLTKNVSEGKYGNDIFGSDRNDEIGELSRAIQQTALERYSQQRLSRAVNKAAIILLVPTNEKNFEDSLLEGMEIIGRCVDVDRMNIWQNETIDGTLHYVKQVQWLSDTCWENKCAADKRPYNQDPEWEEAFLKNECLNGPVSSRAPHEQKILISWGIKSILAIPLYIQGQFYGLFSFVDCRNERYFTEYEINILRSTSLMMVSALNRNAQEKQLRENLLKHKYMMEEIKRRDHLLNTINNSASILFQSEIDEFENNLQKSMSMVSTAVGADRVSIFRNHTKDNHLYCTQVYEWAIDTEPQMHNEITTNISYDKSLPGWEEVLSQGKCVNSLVRTMTPQEQAQLSPQGILSLFAAPVFVNDKFWGFVGYHQHRQEQLFTENEAAIMRSGSLIFTHSLLRNDLALSLRDTAAKLRAIIANYQGIIWCVDKNNTVTLFNGLFLNELGLPPEKFENRTLDDALLDKRLADIKTGVQKTLTEGPQDLNSEVDGKSFRTRTTPIYDEFGEVINVVGSFDDVTERARLQAKLQETLKEAQEANHAKTSFLANMSHEMRTPLNAIIGLSELIFDNGGLSEEAYANLEKIHNAGGTLLSTVNDILDISKIEAGRLELMLVDYDIPSLINDAITQSIMRLGEKPVKFILDIDENMPTRLYGDDLRIKQILNNLLSNAFKYTQEGTVELYIRCERENKDDTVWMTIRVTDTGRGIRKEDMKNLFSDYAQIDTKYNRKIEGTGLGLPITQKISEMMGGTIDVESEYGKGSVFTVRIQQKFITDTVIGPSVVRNLKDSRHSASKRARNSQFTRIKMPYAQVLVVDDVPTNLDVAKGMLKLYDMHVDCVSSGQEAVDAIRSEKVRYNAIFMDHMMPGMNGIEATRIIREEIGTEYAKTVPIIALTANAIVGNENMFLNNGFQAFISKPIDMQRLDSVIREWVRDKTLEEQFSDITPDKPEKAERPFIWQIGGFNLRTGFERFGCDEESFLDVLRSYVNNTPPLLDTIRNPNKDNLEHYTITVHGIKGASHGIGAEAAGDMAGTLEKAAKAGDLTFINAHNPDLLEITDKLIDGIKNMLSKIDVDNPRPKKDKLDREILLKLSSACEKFDMDEIDDAMQEIETFEYASDKELVIWLRENVDNLNFIQIKERLSTMV